MPPYFCHSRIRCIEAKATPPTAHRRTQRSRWSESTTMRVTTKKRRKET
jgi:hypothetical protein